MKKSKGILMAMLVAAMLTAVPFKARAADACTDMGNFCNRQQQIALVYAGYCWWTGMDYYCDMAAIQQEIADDCYEAWFDLCQVVMVMPSWGEHKA